VLFGEMLSGEVLIAGMVGGGGGGGGKRRMACQLLLAIV